MPVESPISACSIMTWCAQLPVPRIATSWTKTRPHVRSILPSHQGLPDAVRRATAARPSLVHEDPFGPTATLPTERGRSLVFAGNPDLSPPWVISVLLAPTASRPVAWMWPRGFGQIHTSVHAGGAASETDPHTQLRVTDCVAFGVAVCEALAAASPYDPGDRVGDMAKAGIMGRVGGIRRRCGRLFGFGYRCHLSAHGGTTLGGVRAAGHIRMESWLSAGRRRPVADGLTEPDQNGPASAERQDPQGPVLAKHGKPKDQRQGNDQQPGSSVSEALSGGRGDELQGASPECSDG
jgi:hypothetical protein